MADMTWPGFRGTLPQYQYTGGPIQPQFPQATSPFVPQQPDVNPSTGPAGKYGVGQQSPITMQLLMQRMGRNGSMPNNGMQSSQFGQIGGTLNRNLGPPMLMNRFSIQ